MDSTSKHTPPLRVAAVVSFYMFAALVVCSFWSHPFTSPGAHLLSRWSLCTPLRTLTCLAFPDLRSRPPKRNKAVLNSSPDLPLIFLFLQLTLAVFLLHVAALFSSRVEIPNWDWYTAKKLFPVVTINVIGLVFNTLCLREVEATFFQVGYISVFYHLRRPAQTQSSDCKGLGLTVDYCYHPRQISPTAGFPCHSRSWSCHHRIFRWCHS